MFNLGWLNDFVSAEKKEYDDFKVNMQLIQITEKVYILRKQCIGSFLCTKVLDIHKILERLRD
jgi:hypothetical protein